MKVSRIGQNNPSQILNEVYGIKFASEGREMVNTSITILDFTTTLVDLFQMYPLFSPWTSQYNRNNTAPVNIGPDEHSTWLANQTDTLTYSTSAGDIYS